MEPYPSTSFYFELQFNNENIPFQEVSGISAEIEREADPYLEDQSKFKIPTPPKYTNLTLKRGVLPADSKLKKWCSDSISGGLSIPIKTYDVSVVLLDPSGVVMIKWTFHKAWPVKWTLSDFKSEENNIIIESIELAYNYFERT